MATRVFYDGFEAFSGTWPTSGTTVPYAGYPFRCYAADGNSGTSMYNWPFHIRNCRILTTSGADVDRNGATGTKYMHHGFCQEIADPQLGNQTAVNVSSCAIMGYPGYTVPTGASTFNLHQARKDADTPFLFFRFWFRCTDAPWGMRKLIQKENVTPAPYVTGTATGGSSSTIDLGTSLTLIYYHAWIIKLTHAATGVIEYRHVAATGTDLSTLSVTPNWDNAPVSGDAWACSHTFEHPYMKFIRLGNNSGSFGDATGMILHLGCGSTIHSGDFANPSLGWQFLQFHRGADNLGHWIGFKGPPNVAMDDGEWHSICWKVEVLNETNTFPNCASTVWIDNWNCIGGASTANFYSDQLHQPSMNLGPGVWQIAENFSGQYPQDLMGLDIDDLEVWAGAPTTEELSGYSPLQTLDMSTKRYYYRLRVQDENGKISPWSAPGWFLTSDRLRAAMQWNTESSPVFSITMSVLEGVRVTYGADAAMQWAEFLMNAHMSVAENVVFSSAMTWDDFRMECNKYQGGAVNNPTMQAHMWNAFARHRGGFR